MNFLLKYKGYLIGGSIIIALLLLANHFQDQALIEKTNQKWETSIREAKPVEVSRDTTRTPQPEIKGEAVNQRQYTPKKHLDVPQIASLVPDSLIDSLDYYNWLLQEYSVEVKDTSGAELEMTAKPRESSISYVLKLPPKEQINTRIENQVLIPPVEKNWIIGVGMDYQTEFGAGWVFGVKPIVVGASYFKNFAPLYKVQFQFEF